MFHMANHGSIPQASGRFTLDSSSSHLYGKIVLVNLRRFATSTMSLRTYPIQIIGKNQDFAIMLVPVNVQSL